MLSSRSRRLARLAVGVLSISSLAVPAASAAASAEVPPADVPAEAVWVADAVGAPAVWDRLGGVGQAGDGVVVGIVGTGLWPEHPAFDPPAGPAPDDGRPCEFGDDPTTDGVDPFVCDAKVVGGRAFLDAYTSRWGAPLHAGTARDDTGAGTHDAALVAGAPEWNGVAAGASIAAYRACAAQGCETADVAAAIRAATADGVDILLVDCTCAHDHARPVTEPVPAAMLEAFEAGALVVQPVGDGGPNLYTAYDAPPWVLAPAAIDRSGTVAEFSSRGSSWYVAKPDVAAPGVAVTSAGSPRTDPVAGPGSSTLTRSSTSVAAAVTAGSAALLRHARPGWGPAAVRSALSTAADDQGLTAPPLPNGQSWPQSAYGPGRLRVDRSIDAGLAVVESGAGFRTLDPCVCEPADLNEQWGLWLNLPSVISMSRGGGRATRVVTSTAADTATWTFDASAVEPAGAVRVEPASFTLAPGASVPLAIEVDGADFETEGIIRFTSPGLPAMAVPFIWSINPIGAAAPTITSVEPRDDGVHVTWEHTDPGPFAGSRVTPYVDGRALRPLWVPDPATETTITGIPAGAEVRVDVRSGPADGRLGRVTPLSDAVRTGPAPCAPWADCTTAVVRIHQALRGTTPGPAAVSSTVAALETGDTSLPDLIAGHRTSVDHTTNVDPVVRLYRAFFLRTAEPTGLAYWADRRRGGTPVDTIALSFARSREFTGRYGTLTDAQFVDLVYRNVLDRPGEPAGTAFWTEELRTRRRTRGQVTVGFSEATEHKRRRAGAVHATVLWDLLAGRTPTADEVRATTDRLALGEPIDAIVTDFLRDPDVTALAAAT